MSWNHWLANRKQKQEEVRESRRQLIAWYHDHGELVPPAMLCYLGGGASCVSRMGYSHREVLNEMYRVGSIKQAEANARAKT